MADFGRTCPLCGGIVKFNSCIECGFEKPDFEKMAKLYALEPKSEPQNQEPSVIQPCIREVIPEYNLPEIYPEKEPLYPPQNWQGADIGAGNNSPAANAVKPAAPVFKNNNPYNHSYNAPYQPNVKKPVRIPARIKDKLHIILITFFILVALIGSCMNNRPPPKQPEPPPRSLNSNNFTAVNTTMNEPSEPIRYIEAIPMVDTERVAVIALKSDGTVLTNMDESEHKNWSEIVQVAALDRGFVGLKEDGTVVFSDRLGDLNKKLTPEWEDVIQISTTNSFNIAALKSDGTVVSNNKELNDMVSDWGGIVQVCAGEDFVLGLKEDGTVVMSGTVRTRKEFIEDMAAIEAIMSEWTDIVALSYSDTTYSTHPYRRGPYVVGLKSDGTVVSTIERDLNLDQTIWTPGWATEHDLSFSEWTDIVQISAGRFHIVGLKRDETVVSTTPGKSWSSGALEWYHYGENLVSDWENIVYISAGEGVTIGLKSDGTLVSAGLLSRPPTEEGVATGLKSDGTLIPAGLLSNSTSDIHEWNLMQGVSLGHLEKIIAAWKYKFEERDILLDE